MAGLSIAGEVRWHAAAVWDGLFFVCVCWEIYVTSAVSGSLQKLLIGVQLVTRTCRAASVAWLKFVQFGVGDFQMLVRALELSAQVQVRHLFLLERADGTGGWLGQVCLVFEYFIMSSARALPLIEAVGFAPDFRIFNGVRTHVLELLMTDNTSELILHRDIISASSLRAGDILVKARLWREFTRNEQNVSSSTLCAKSHVKFWALLEVFAAVCTTCGIFIFVVYCCNLPHEHMTSCSVGTFRPISDLERHGTVVWKIDVHGHGGLWAMGDGVHRLFGTFLTALVGDVTWARRGEAVLVIRDIHGDCLTLQHVWVEQSATS